MVAKKNTQELPPVPDPRFIQTPVPASKTPGEDAEGPSLSVDDAALYEEFLQTQQFQSTQETVPELSDDVFEPSSDLAPLFPEEPDVNDDVFQPSSGASPFFSEESERHAPTLLSSADPAPFSEI